MKTQEHQVNIIGTTFISSIRGDMYENIGEIKVTVTVYSKYHESPYGIRYQTKPLVKIDFDPKIELFEEPRSLFVENGQVRLVVMKFSMDEVIGVKVEDTLDTYKYYEFFYIQ